MLFERKDQAEWLEWSGLPRELNEARAGAWPVFKKLVELDCRVNPVPGQVEIALEELGERCGLEPAALRKIIEALRKKKCVRCYLPDTDEEPALFEILVPLRTPRTPEEVARRVPDPALRDLSAYRYVAPPPARSAEDEKIQAVADLYLNFISQKMNGFVFEQIEIAARRFPLEDIRRIMERAASHNLRTMGWVLKELIQDAARPKKDK